MKDAIRVDGNNDLGAGVLESITDRARLAAVHVISANADADVRKIALSFEHPLIAIIRGTIVLRDYLEEVTGIVTFADALDGLVDCLAFVVTRQQDTDCRLARIVFAYSSAGEGPLEYQSHKVLDD